MTGPGAEALLARAAGRLLDWYGAHARPLPWRDNPEPYRVWVSEVMLQQTRIEAVKPYFARFMEALPTVGHLARAPEDQVLKLWEGLGYYSRARSLHRAAKDVMEKYGGEIPGTVKGLLALPGVGRYTAGAVASIAFGEDAAAVDGNVLRVWSRLLCREEDVLSPAVRKRAEEELAAALPSGRAGDFNQAIMELGEVVCVPRSPRCGACPLEDICEARGLGVEGSLPVKAPKKPRRVEKRTVFWLTHEGKVALRQRPGKGLLAGLWEPPSCEGWLEGPEALAFLEGWGMRAGPLRALPPTKHVFSHLEWHMQNWAAQVQAPGGGFTWASPGQLERDMALPSAFSPELLALAGMGAAVENIK